ncbi:MAG: hypothetical protein ACLQBX_06460 [Candidatus Limnocylindrales bacterium]|jgi:hypothetical protein
MSTRLRLLAATLGGSILLLGSLLGAVAPVAAASSSTTSGPCAALQATYKASETVANGIALGNCMISERLTFLGNESTQMAKHTSLTSGDLAALSTIDSADTSGLTSLQTTLDGESSLTGVQSDLANIVKEYRVYVLFARQVTLVEGADAVSATQAHFTTLSTKLQDRINTAAAKGKNTTAASAQLADMNSAVSRAMTDVSGLSSELLALTPSEYNAGSAKSVLSHARTAVLRARAQLLDARADALRVVADLR